VADRPRILLVDDEQPIQTLLSFPLQRDGYEVVQASDGREALARFAEQRFDLVVLDVMLPRMDGLEVCRRLRAQRERVPIIMLCSPPSRRRSTRCSASSWAPTTTSPSLSACASSAAA
jgi:DNA-binding response OmpR family regulator